MMLLAGVMAWVLWGQGSPPLMEWFPTAGYPTYEVCVKNRDQVQAISLERSQKRGEIGIWYECFPETLDPRIPREKK